MRSDPPRLPLGLRLKAWLVWLLARLLLRSLRVRVSREETRDGRPSIYAFWHGRQLALFRAHPERPLGVLSSTSRDGRMQAWICSRFGLTVALGSSTRGGLGALLALGRMLRGGVSVGLAVDGPRGPAFEAKAGILALARAAGAPIVPVAAGYSRAIELGRAWDRFQIPLPFTCARVAYGEPIAVPHAISALELEELRRRLTDQLRLLTAQVDRAAQKGTDDP